MSSESDFLGELERTARDMLGRVAAGQPLQELKRRLAEVERRREGVLEAEVVTAVPVTDAERQVFEERLHDRYGDKLPISFVVDPAVLGGAVVRVGDRMVDGSLAARLAQLRENLVGSSGAGR